jgi:hypothetical protein
VPCPRATYQLSHGAPSIGIVAGSTPIGLEKIHACQHAVDAAIDHAESPSVSENEGGSRRVLPYPADAEQSRERARHTPTDSVGDCLDSHRPMLEPERLQTHCHVIGRRIGKGLGRWISAHEIQVDRYDEISACSLKK